MAGPPRSRGLKANGGPGSHHPTPTGKALFRIVGYTLADSKQQGDITKESIENSMDDIIDEDIKTVS